MTTPPPDEARALTHEQVAHALSILVPGRHDEIADIYGDATAAYVLHVACDGDVFRYDNGDEPARTAFLLAALAVPVGLRFPNAGGLCACGFPMSRNPHHRAGRMETLTMIGATWVCIPCAVAALHRADRRAAEETKAREEAERDINAAEAWFYAWPEKGNPAPIDGSLVEKMQHIAEHANLAALTTAREERDVYKADLAALGAAPDDVGSPIRLLREAREEGERLKQEHDDLVEAAEEAHWRIMDRGDHPKAVAADLAAAILRASLPEGSRFRPERLTALRTPPTDADEQAAREALQVHTAPLCLVSSNCVRPRGHDGRCSRTMRDNGDPWDHLRTALRALDTTRANLARMTAERDSARIAHIEATVAVKRAREERDAAHNAAIEEAARVCADNKTDASTKAAEPGRPITSGAMWEAVSAAHELDAIRIRALSRPTEPR